MKVKDLINFLQTLNQENELLFADYYYDSREGFIPWNNNAKMQKLYDTIQIFFVYTI